MEKSFKPPLFFPCTFFSVTLFKEIFSFFSEIYLLYFDFFPSPFSEESESLLSPEERGKIKFLSPDIENVINPELFLKEVSSLQKWAENFRNPEDLEYFSSFLANFKDYFEENFSYLSKVILNKVEEQEPEFYVKKALTILYFAHIFDSLFEEVLIYLEKLKKKFNQIFKEKVIGKEETFSSFEEEILKQARLFSEKALVYSELPFGRERVWAFKQIFPYLNIEAYHLSSLLLPDSSLFDVLQVENVEKLEVLNPKLESYVVNTPLGEILSPNKKTSVNLSQTSTLIYVYKAFPLLIF